MRSRRDEHEGDNSVGRGGSGSAVVTGDMINEKGKCRWWQSGCGSGVDGG